MHAAPLATIAETEQSHVVLIAPPKHTTPILDKFFTAPTSATTEIITMPDAEKIQTQRTRLPSREEVIDRPAVIIISHSDDSIILQLRRQFDLLKFRVEIKKITSTDSPISPSFPKTSVDRIKNLEKERALAENQIHVIEYELNCGKSDQTPLREGKTSNSPTTITPFKTGIASNNLLEQETSNAGAGKAAVE